jgi:L-seryl-tRNA(Ser) seleniumtransferase
MAPSILRNIPSVNDLIESPPLKKLVERVSHNVVADGVRSFLDEMRQNVAQAASEVKLPDVGELAERIAGRILQGEQPSLRPVINATGILLHTGLGRAPLADEAIEAMVTVAKDYASVELDLKSGQRSQRVAAVETVLKQITGAEAVAVVNNNAGATMLTLAALARDKEVICSRGELVEIGGSFRLPDVMAISGATLREVGTTNKTHLRDYASAIGEETAAVMQVHTSNYLVVGFTAAPSLADLVQLGRKHDLPVIHDIGSGALIDFAQYGLTGEPLAAESVRTGADVVLFSGDKLMGGPQCGIIIGRKKYVDAISRHPMMRALRVDKVTLAALAETLRLYRDPKMAEASVPLLQLLSTSIENLKNRAERLAPQMAAAEAVSEAAAVEEVAQVGGGSMPTQEIPTWCIALAPSSGGVDGLAASLRTGKQAVVGRIQQDRLLLDLRTVPPRQDRLLVEAVEAVSIP